MSFVFEDDDPYAASQESGTGANIMTQDAQQFVCENCGSNECYYDQVAGKDVCQECFTQSQQINTCSQEVETMEYDEVMGLAAKTKGGKVVWNRKRGASRRKSRGLRLSKRQPLEELDKSVPLPELETCLEGIQLILKTCAKRLAHLLGLQPLERKAMLKNVGKLWIAYLQAYADAAEYYGAMHSEFRFSLRDAFLAATHKYMVIQNVTYHTAEALRREAEQQQQQQKVKKDEEGTPDPSHYEDLNDNDEALLSSQKEALEDDDKKPAANGNDKALFPPQKEAQEDDDDDDNDNDKKPAANGNDKALLPPQKDAQEDDDDNDNDKKPAANGNDKALLPPQKEAQEDDDDDDNDKKPAANDNDKALLPSQKEDDDDDDNDKKPAASDSDKTLLLPQKQDDNDNDKKPPANDDASTAVAVQKLSFPSKLQRILDKMESEGKSDAISWLSHGRAFIIYDEDRFANQLMPLYFNVMNKRMTKYGSFQNQLYSHNFKRITADRVKGAPHHPHAYYHPYFQRGRPELCLVMTRRRTVFDRYHFEADDPHFHELEPMPNVPPGTTIEIPLYYPAVKKPAALRPQKRPAALRPQKRPAALRPQKRPRSSSPSDPKDGDHKSSVVDDEDDKPWNGGEREGPNRMKKELLKRVLEASIVRGKRHGYREAALKLQPSMDFVAALLWLTVCKSGVTSFQITQWIAEDSLPLQNSYNLLTTELRKKLRPVHTFFRLSSPLVPHFLEGTATLLAVACRMKSEGTFVPGKQQEAEVIAGSKDELCFWSQSCFPLLVAKLVANAGLEQTVLDRALALMGLRPTTKTKMQLPKPLEKATSDEITCTDDVLAIIAIACQMDPSWRSWTFRQAKRHSIPYNECQLLKMSNGEFGQYLDFAEKNAVDQSLLWDGFYELEEEMESESNLSGIHDAHGDDKEADSRSVVKPSSAMAGVRFRKSERRRLRQAKASRSWIKSSYAVLEEPRRTLLLDFLANSAQANVSRVREKMEFFLGEKKKKEY
jgi:hypothetical protein